MAPESISNKELDVSAADQYTWIDIQRLPLQDFDFLWRLTIARWGGVSIAISMPILIDKAFSNFLFCHDFSIILVTLISQLLGSPTSDRYFTIE